MEQNIYKIKKQSKNKIDTKTEFLPDIISKIKYKLEEYKSENINIYNLESNYSYTKIAIIAQANSSTHLNALRENIFLFLKNKNILPLIKPEKQTNANWLVLDYVDFVIHLLLPEVREKYGLDNLFSLK